MASRHSRRDFLKQSAAVGAAWWVGTQRPLHAQERSPLERVNFACIGVDGKGDSDSGDAANLGNIVALCDIDDQRIEKKSRKLAGRFPEIKKYNDYRQMLEELGDKVDAVTVSTPDHVHAPASVMAMRLGKHCFCQKPLTWSVQEARVMREVAAEKGVATQMGNQGTSHDGLREAVESVRYGALGEVREVHIWTNRPIWPQGEGRPAGSDTPPSYIHWDLFLGPAPERPYVNNVYHPFKWRGWLDFGTGALGDMACHTANMAVMALDLFDPVTIEVAESPGVFENETYPKFSTLVFQFPERKGLPACKVTWYDGGKRPPQELLMGEKLADSGSLLVGSEGTLYSPNDYGSSYVLLPKDKFADFKKPEPTLPRSPGHFEEFVRACKGGEPAMSNFDYAGRLTETILLGNVALRANQKIEWDAKSMKAKNLPDFTGGITRDYRAGFSI
ncbi:MAG TPA: Gfo/Idh/MocA family oxidoreductase [Planctomycetaceae bacterium]|nr:Gfo/Idh/MocA family oxidoreductase [Planctomycetaceae bacterium]